jgi:hypothetical protein
VPRGKEEREVKRLVIKSRGRMWPKVAWEGSQLVVYYLGVEDDDVSVEETREIDFEELLFKLDNGNSIFLTMKPRSVSTLEPILGGR